MLPAQDHKRLGNNDIGPNTGGMGAYCPCPIINEHDLQLAITNVLQRAVHGFRSSGIDYQGVLYAGLMLTPSGPKTLEFNCRFGDPETQVILPLLKTDLYEIMKACCEHRLDDINIEWKSDLSAVGVVMASAGYPETSTKGCKISGTHLAVIYLTTLTLKQHFFEIGLRESSENNIVFHSGTEYKSGHYVTNGGRVLINVCLGMNLKVAATEATNGCKQIVFSDAAAQYRTDIAHKAFKL